MRAAYPAQGEGSDVHHCRPGQVHFPACSATASNAQLLIESPERSALHRFLDGWLPQIEPLPSARRVRWALDVDPIELF